MAELPNTYLKDTLKSILRNEGLDPETKYTIRDHNLQLWISSIHRITVNSKSENKNEDLNLFFKCLPENREIRSAFDVDTFFQNEISFYNNVLNPLLKFQEKKCVKNPFNAVPKCYQASSNEEKYLIVLEDLEPSGYIMLDRHKQMGLQELQLIMKELGRFHALSLAMKHQDPEGFSQIRMAVKETVFYDKFLAKFGKLYDYVVKDAIAFVKRHFPHDSPYVTKFLQYENNITDRMRELVTAKEEDEPYNVINRADVWVNNFVFKYPDENISSAEGPIALKMLDFQASRYASPVLDVSCVLLSSADTKIRNEHQDSLLHCYYDSLSDLLVELGSDPQVVFPYDAFEMQLKKYTEFGLWMTILNVPHTLDKGESIDANKPSADSESGDCADDVISSLTAVYRRRTEECEQRILDVIKEVIDNGYF